jgi:hypothetical protein
MRVTCYFWLAGDLPRETDACHEPAQVLGVGGEVELDQRLDARIGACEEQTAGGARAFERNR